MKNIKGFYNFLFILLLASVNFKLYTMHTTEVMPLVTKSTNSRVAGTALAGYVALSGTYLYLSNKQEIDTNIRTAKETIKEVSSLGAQKINNFYKTYKQPLTLGWAILGVSLLNYNLTGQNLLKTAVGLSSLAAFNYLSNNISKAIQNS